MIDSYVYTIEHNEKDEEGIGMIPSTIFAGINLSQGLKKVYDEVNTPAVIINQEVLNYQVNVWRNGVYFFYVPVDFTISIERNCEKINRKLMEVLISDEEREK